MRPNILLIMTDQERAVQHMAGVDLDSILPARARLKKEGISFENFYINSSPCTPNRAVMLTGLYSQQVWMCTNPGMLGQPSLKTEFATYAKALRDIGYDTVYAGKWHISEDMKEDNPYVLKEYGFNYYDPPNEAAGLPNQGGKDDEPIANSAVNFITSRHPQNPPFLSVVSFVNPHDIMFYYRLMNPRKPSETYPDLQVPENFESLKHMLQDKPQCQAQYRAEMNLLLGKLPNDIKKTEDKNKYLDFLNYYLWLEKQVDLQIQKVLDALDANPDIKKNTIVIFTSDHGEMAGSHGLRGKNYVTYEEALRVPFYVVDYTNTLIPPNQQGTTRNHLGCTVDIFPTILSMVATTGDPVDKEKYYFLPGVDLTPHMVDATKPTRDQVLFAHDFVIPTIKAPSHILGLIEGDWKGAVYDQWQMDDPNCNPQNPDEAVKSVPGCTEEELYKRATPEDRLEKNNLAQDVRYCETMNKIKTRLQTLLETELRGPLPLEYQLISDQAQKDYVDSILAKKFPAKEGISKKDMAQIFD